jgi:hypothetical protein
LKSRARARAKLKKVRANKRKQRGGEIGKEKVRERKGVRKRKK